MSATLPPGVGPALAKPRLRGRLHAVAFVVSLPLGAWLVAVARQWRGRASAGVFVASVAALFGTSAAYHRLRWTAPALRRMRRLDHSMIYVLIAGTYTPFGLLALDGWSRWTMLGAVWGGAIGGVVLKMISLDRLRVLGGTLYIVLGWLAVLASPAFVRTLRPATLALILAGGILYTGGAVVLLRRRPDPSPRVFGYHEVWHACTVAAWACHYVAVFLLVRAV